MNDLITQVKEEKTGVQVTVNDGDVFWLSHSAYRERPLIPGQAIDYEEFKKWLLTQQYPQALNKAVAFLATRARSGQEVRQKLESKRYMERTIELVLYKLEKERILDDEAFARDWAAARANRQLGKARIVMELRQKGVSREVAERALGALDGEENESQAIRLAVKLLKRYENEGDARKRLQKVIAAMARRGYGYGEASGAVEAALKELQEE